MVLVFQQESAIDTDIDPDSHLPQKFSPQLVTQWTLTPYVRDQGLSDCIVFY